MQWISKKNQHIASRARLKSPPAARAESDTPPTKKKWLLIASGLSNAIARATGTLAGASITLITSFLGAAAAAYLTINYLESFKAQEALRTFAVTQLYQPLRQKSLKCHELRIEATSNARIVSNTSELVLLHLKDIRNRKENSRLTIPSLYCQLSRRFSNTTRKHPYSYQSWKTKSHCASERSHLPATNWLPS